MDVVLASRELGLESGDIAEKYVRYRLSYSLDLSNTVEVLQNTPATTTSIDIEESAGRFMISGTSNGRIVMYDLEGNENGKNRLVTVPAEVHGAHSRSISGVCWYPLDAGLFTSCSMDNQVKVWDPHSLEAALSLGGTASPHVRLCDLRSGAATHMLDGIGTVLLWLLEGHRDAVMSVCWSPREEFLLATGSSDRSIRLWDIRKARSSLLSLDLNNTFLRAEDDQGSSAVSQAHRGPVNGLTFTSDGFHLLSCGNDNRVRLWDVFHGKNLLVNYGGNIKNKHTSTITPIVTSLDNRSYQPILFHPNDDHTISMHSLMDGSLIKVLRGHFGKVTSMAYHPFQDELYSASLDKEILNWSGSLYPHQNNIPSSIDETDPEVGEKRPREEDEWSD